MSPPDVGLEPPDDEARALRGELETLAAAWLDPYVDALATGRVRVEQKVLNDAVWGSIRLFPWEIAVLDSPLMQRLRGLRQLGVIHWVYPNAGHSRFEHSVGVVQMIQLLVDCIERNSGKAGEQIIDDVTRMLMRLAGLVHDCGHTVMSHVSESFIETRPGVRELRRWLDDIYRPRKPCSASEAIAAVLVRSPAFRRLLSQPEIGADFIRDVDQAASVIAGLLLGAPAVPRKAFLSLVINGAFDADKLDYMPRDCLMAGVPCAVDVARLVEKVHCVSVPAGELVEQLAEYRKWAQIAPGEDLLVLALPRSAVSALDELAVTRTILFDKVYFHQKVRALEVMVRRLLALRHELSVVDWLALEDQDILKLDQREARDLKDRLLLKRAFYVAGAEDAASEEEITSAGAGWRSLRRDQKRGRADELILAAAKEACSHLGLDPEGLDRVPPALDFPPAKRVELDQFAFVGDDFRDLESADAAVSGQRSEAGKHIARSGGYVYAHQDYLLPVFFGALRVLHRSYKQPIHTAAYAKTKLEPRELEVAEATLRSHAFLEGDDPALQFARGIASQRARHMEQFLRTAWPRIEMLAVDFGRYQAPWAAPLSSARIASFLRQFEEVHRARAALRMLESVELKDRTFFTSALRSLLSNLPHEIDYVCPLGGSGDSSAILAYFMNDLPGELRREVVPLEIALERGPTKGLLLWDDFCGDGGHTITALAQWTGGREAIQHDEKLKRHLLYETLASPLTKDRMEALLGVQSSIAFAMARPNGVENVRAAIGLLGLTQAQVLEPFESVSQSDDLFEGDHPPFINDRERDDLRSFFVARSREILKDRTERPDAPWSVDKLEQRVLGYGNTAKLLVFFYNVPTVTLTPLWASGEHSGWQPLFPRRTKPAATEGTAAQAAT